MQTNSIMFRPGSSLTGWKIGQSVSATIIFVNDGIESSEKGVRNANGLSDGLKQFGGGKGWSAIGCAMLSLSKKFVWDILHTNHRKTAWLSKFADYVSCFSHSPEFGDASLDVSILETTT
jgi:hypothetical protein